jgi:hypothetical protein
MHSQLKTGKSEERGDRDIVKQHRRDQSSRGGASCVVTRQPASDAQGKQRNSGDASEHRRGGAVERRTEQQLNDDGGHGHQAQTGGRFDESGEF